MQHIFYSNNTFVKEDSAQYTLSIRFSTDGLSFCIYDTSNKLIVFVFRPYTLGSTDEVVAKVKKTIVEDEFLNLKYKKVYINPCTKDKILIPAHVFNKNYLPDIYRTCLPSEKNDTLLYRKIKTLEAYICESLPRSFVAFLSARYQSLCIVNSAYPFIINSLASTLLNTHHLFIDIYEHYFDVLICKNDQVILFNSFSYSAIPDLIYYLLLCLKKSKIDKGKLRTVISGYLVNDPKLYQILSSYIPNISLITDNKLAALLKNNDLNTSCFVHQLTMHTCE